MTASAATGRDQRIVLRNEPSPTTTPTDHNFRLIKLLSLIMWADRDRDTAALRYGHRAGDLPLSASARDTLTQVIAHYAGAVDYHNGHRDGAAKLDQRNLPGFVLEFVTTVPEPAVRVLGELVGRSLGIALNDGVDRTGLTQCWIADVRETAWRLHFAGLDAVFGE